MKSYINEPLVISMAVPNGNYEVTLSIKAHEDTVFSVLSQSRRFIRNDVVIKDGESMDIVFNANVCDYHFDGGEYTEVKTIDIYILCDGAVTATAAVSPVDIPTIYIAGDSTVTDQPAEYPYEPSETFCGWGQALQGFLKPGIAVSNHAQSGSCTMAFIGTNWTAFKDKIRPGDVLVCEFGHNDQKIKELDAYGGYAQRLRYFVEYAREKGAYPILNSPINRIIFEPDGTLRNLLGEYRDAVKSVAEEMNVPFIDMWKRTTEYFETAGPVKSWGFFRCKGNERDYTHTNDIGGLLIAKFFAQEIVKNGVKPIADFVDENRIETVQVTADEGDSFDNSSMKEHLKMIGLVNIPDGDIDADITGLQI